MASPAPTEIVHVFGRKRHAIAVAHCQRGRGHIRVNGAPIETIQPVVLRYKVLEPLLLLGQDRFSNLDLRIRVRGGGFVAQLYAIRQAISKAIVAYYQKCIINIFQFK